MRFHLLFEQSGTFKNVLKQHGHEAYDYDILDNYGQTDFKIDLFKEIEQEYENIVMGGGNTYNFYKYGKRKRFYNCFLPLHPLL